MIKTIKIFILEITIIFLFVIVIPSTLIKETYLINYESISDLKPLTNKEVYVQKISNSHNLNSVSIMIKNPNIKNKEKIFVDLEDEKQNKIEQFVISGANVGDPSWVKLKFVPIPNNEIFLKITSENIDPYGLQIFFKDNKFNLQATTKNNSFMSRTKENINYQYNQFTKRSLIHTMFYLVLILFLNYCYIKK